MPVCDQKRMNLFIPVSLFREMDEIVSPASITKSEFIRTAISEYIDKIRKQELEKELEEGYKAMAEEHRQFAELSSEAANEIILKLK